VGVFPPGVGRALDVIPSSLNVLTKLRFQPSPNRLNLLALFAAFAVAMPSTLFYAGGNVRATAWAWFLDLMLIGPLALSEPLRVRAVRYLSPYLIFLGYSALTLAWTIDLQKGVLGFLQMVVPALAYLLAWRVVSDVSEFKDRIAVACTMALVLVAVLWLAGSAGISLLELSTRPAAISLTVIFTGATLTATSWRWTALIGSVAILVAALTGARMSALVLLLLLLWTPSLGARMRWRILAAVLAFVILLTVSQTEAFKRRFFFGTDATLLDAITLSSKLDTSGRREAWPRITTECSTSAVFGKGIGSAALVAGHLAQPHNDYLRTYCDQGLVGGLLFWGFFLFAGVRSIRRVRYPTSDRQLHAAAGLLVLAFLLFALTDNPMVYTAHFMTPFMIIMGLSDATWHWRAERRGSDLTVAA
jgi:O-antigen ligase